MENDCIYQNSQDSETDCTKCVYSFCWEFYMMKAQITERGKMHLWKTHIN